MNPSYRQGFDLIHWIRGNVLRGLPVFETKEYGMNANELRDKTPDQLRDELTNLKKESFNLRFQQATGQLENTAGIRAARRNAAKVKTILNEKAAAAAKEA
jgi:large subunit ribosomal protein L29